MKYASIDELRSEFPVKSLCRVLDISRSLYYAFKKARPSLHSQEDLALRAEIVRINAAHRWAPGAIKMWRLLNAEGIQCGKHRVRRLRKLENIQTTRIKRFRVMQAMERVQPPAPDLVKRGFQVNAPNKIWVGDMTCLRTREGWIHLAIVLDLFARRIVGWSMDATQAATLPMAALSMALAQRKPCAGLIFHSDQGTVYGSHDYRELMQAHGVRASMSRKGNCHDNAVAESFFSNLKNEAMHGRLFASRDEARAVVNDYIEVYYNRQRLHQTLGYQTPAAVEAAFRVLN
ncbi:IS3 family transposase [Massilia niastensis]|uniref:IS3 family transposase n=1 Tax=Massilia niastensis TaxID=544911 RepID=UPI00037790B6|nr:IS3 family transposase [Massilia niastensis]